MFAHKPIACESQTTIFILPEFPSDIAYYVIRYFTPPPCYKSGNKPQTHLDNN